MEYCYKIQLDGKVVPLFHILAPVSVSLLSLVLAVAILELKENLNYLQCAAVAKACLEGLIIQNETQITFPALFEKIS